MEIVYYLRLLLPYRGQELAVIEISCMLGVFVNEGSFMLAVISFVPAVVSIALAVVVKEVLLLELEAAFLVAVLVIEFAAFVSDLERGHEST